MVIALWQGTFAEAEARENAYWAAQTPEYRLATMLQIREMHYGQAVYQPMEKVVYRRKLGEEGIDRSQEAADIAKLKKRNEN